ncbi:MAG: hypothetical protein K6F88_07440 [Ruminococcus sp.]|nr:hypothetical protein [Ruminococcus sp.]
MFTSDKEDNNLYSRADDALNLSQLRHNPCFLGFLNEREQFIISERFSYAKSKIRFFGGYDNAARRVMCACDYDVDNDDFPIDKLCYKFRKEDSLSHRDFLGSLMGLGIERSCIGDIIIEEQFAAVFVKSEVCDYIKSQLTKVGRAGVKLIPDNECLLSYEPDIEVLHFIVSSMRLDAVVAAITKLSRTKSASLILSGKVFTNYFENHNISYILKPDDILTIRGNGKFIIEGQSSVTKKGRLKININHYR